MELHPDDDKLAFNKTVKATVFYNHFKAIRQHIESFKDRNDLRLVNFYNDLRRTSDNAESGKSFNYLLNSWSTEKTLLFPIHVDASEYLRYSLQWSFPQAYYSVYLNMAAFRETRGSQSNNHQSGIRAFGTSINHGHYPEAISFRAVGLYKNFRFHGLSEFPGHFKGFNSSEEVSNLSDAQTQIASFLNSTRKGGAKENLEKLKKRNDEGFQSENGEFLKRLSKKHWDKIYKTIPATSLMNLLYRLRIIANYHNVEAFVNADLDFKAFHENLIFIVDYLNFVHEAYFVKVVGNSRYKKLIGGIPKDLISDTAIRRYELIKKI
jgi:hypothetical protein